jgi:hypothetical protein
MLREALAIGLSVDAFWSLTPREMRLHFEAAAIRAEREYQRDAWLAWHIAALSRAKRMPTLKKLLQTDKAKPLRGEELDRRQAEHAELIANATKPRKRDRIYQARSSASPSQGDAR